MNLNDLKATGQAASINNNAPIEHNNRPSTIISNNKTPIIKVDNSSSERKVVSIDDMIEAGVVQVEERVDESSATKVIEQVFDPHSLDESIERRRKEIEETAEKEFYEKAMGEDTYEELPDDVEDYYEGMDGFVDTESHYGENEEEDYDPNYDEYVEDEDSTEHTMYVNNEEEEEENTMLYAASNTDIPSVEVNNSLEDEAVNNTISYTVTEPEVDHIDATSSKDISTSTDGDNSGYKKINFEDELKKLDGDAVGLDSDDEDVDKETFDKLKTLLSEKIRVNNHDLGGFTVIKRPVSLSNALALTPKEATSKNADWVLYYTGIPITMSSFNGDELESMNNATASRNRNNSIREIYGRMYSHIVSPKPGTYEEWLKSVDYRDMDNLFFAIYKANFEGLNYLPYSCTDNNCRHVFLTDNTDIMKMVEFKDEKAEENFNRIYNSSDYNPNGLFAEKIYPISEHYAIGIKRASLYNVLVESIINDREFTSKYSTTINILPFIGNFYAIDYNMKSYQPIAFKRYPNNKDKTLKSKVITYSAIISRLTSDQFSTMLGYVGNMMNSDTDDINYIMPEAVCPKCGATIEKDINQTPSDMVFTRHRLGLARTM